MSHTDTYAVLTATPLMSLDCQVGVAAVICAKHLGPRQTLVTFRKFPASFKCHWMLVLLYSGRPCVAYDGACSSDVSVRMA
jgi:hypothetical protein